MFKNFLNVVLLFTVLGVELSGLLGKFFLSPYLCLVIFFALSSKKLIIIWPIVGGLVLDFFSIFSFPLFTFSFLGVFLVIRFVSQKIIVSKDLVSFIVFSFGGLISYNFIFLFLNTITRLLRIEQIVVSFNQSYFLHLSFNIIFVFFLLIVFRRNQEAYKELY